MRDEHLIRDFIAEAEEHLALLEPNMLRLEKEPENLDLVQEIFLSTHGIKGTAAYVGLSHISDFTHALESLLDRLRKHDLRVTPDVIDALLEGLDTLKLLIAQVASGQPAPETADIEIKLARCQSVAAPDAIASVRELLPFTIERPIIPPEVLAGLDSEDLEIWSDIARQQLEFMRLALTGLQAIVQAGQPETGEQIATPMNALTTAFHNLRTSSAVLQLAAVDQLFEAHAQHLAPFEEPPYTVTEQDLLNIEQMIVDFEVMCETLTAPEAQSAPAPPLTTTASAQPASSSARETWLGVAMLRVNAERVDELLNLIGELVLNRAKLVQASDVVKTLYEDLRTGQTTLLSPQTTQRKKEIQRFKHLKEKLEEVGLNMGRLTNQMQERAMRIRMIPLSQVISRFPRMVRDLSRQAGKNVAIEIHGAETELDKTVIDVIGEPLIHLLRNAIAHGIETPEERQRQGKSPQGKILLSAYHQGNQVVIQVSDDGQGIDFERIKAKALEQHLIPPQQAQIMTEDALIDLIFQTGLSTIETASHLSGRGVGLHIVKRYLEQLNGTIDLATKPHAGSTFTIKLPLTLAIIPALMVDVRSEIFAIPLVSVEEVIRIAVPEIKTIEAHQVYCLREKIIPLVDLADVLGSPVLQPPSHDPSTTAPLEDDVLAEVLLAQDPAEVSGVVISDGTQELGIIVDTVMGENDIVIKSLEHELVHVEGVSGASIQADGQVALVLDAPAIIRLAHRRAQQQKTLNSPRAMPKSFREARS